MLLSGQCPVLSVETMAEEVTEDDEWDMFPSSKLSIEREGGGERERGRRVSEATRESERGIECGGEREGTEDRVGRERVEMTCHDHCMRDLW